MFLLIPSASRASLTILRCVSKRPTLDMSIPAATVSAEIESFKWLGLRCRIKVTGNFDGCSVDLRNKAADPETSLVDTKAVAKDGSVSLIVTDEGNAGTATTLVLLDNAGNVIDKSPVTVGE